MRILSLIITALAALPAFAQMEVGLIDGSIYPTTYEYELDEAQPMAETKSVSMLWGNPDCIRQFPTVFNGVETIKVNGTPVNLSMGVFGQTNPTGDDIFVGGVRGGAQFLFTVNDDGWLVVFTRLHDNKPYFVYEGYSSEPNKLMAYTLAMPVYDLDVCPQGYIKYSLPADSAGYCDLNSPYLTKFLVEGTGKLRWPIKIYSQDDNTQVGGEVSTYGTGVIMFPVYAEHEYWVYATGSKIMSCGYAFIPGKNAPTVTIPGGNASTGGDLTVTPESFTGNTPVEPEPDPEPEPEPEPEPVEEPAIDPEASSATISTGTQTLKLKIKIKD